MHSAAVFCFFLHSLKPLVCAPQDVARKPDCKLVSAEGTVFLVHSLKLDEHSSVTRYLLVLIEHSLSAFNLHSQHRPIRNCMSREPEHT